MNDIDEKKLEEEELERYLSFELKYRKSMMDFTDLDEWEQHRDLLFEKAELGFSYIPLAHFVEDRFIDSILRIQTKEYKIAKIITLHLKAKKYLYGHDFHVFCGIDSNCDVEKEYV